MTALSRIFPRKLWKAFYTNKSDALSQGDILLTKILCENLLEHKKTDVSKDIYPYFFKTYDLAVVINASCDLVCEKGRKPTRCIHLLAITDFSSILADVVKIAPHSSLQICDEVTFDRIKDPVRKMFDGQHKSVYFLPPPKFGNLIMPLAVKLDVGISLRYDCLDSFKEARIPYRLNNIRAAKLAEHYSNLYNRIALDDIAEILGEEKHEVMLREIINWRIIAVQNAVYDASKKELEKVKKDINLSLENKLQKVKNILNDNKNATDIAELQRAIACVESAMQSQGIGPDQIQKTLTLLRKNKDFIAVIEKGRRKTGNV